MWGGGGTGGSGGGGGLDPSALAGYASMGWVEDNYVSKAFFNQLFEYQYNHRVLTKDGETVVSDVTTAMVAAPNEVVDLVSHTETDEETGYTIITTNTITGIKAKAGLWTNQYLSALGQNSSGGGGGGATLFEPLLSINESGLAAPTDAQDGMTVVWDKNTHKWKYGATGGGGITVDSALSLTSENPVQNKVITEDIKEASAQTCQDIVDELIGSGGGGGSLNQPLSAINSADLGTPSQSGVAIMWNGTAWVYQVPGGGTAQYTQKVFLAENGGVLTQAMVNTANTIYVIQYDYDLNGGTIQIFSGCTLEFAGGRIKNGTINNQSGPITINGYGCLVKFQRGANVTFVTPYHVSTIHGLKESGQADGSPEKPFYYIQDALNICNNIVLERNSIFWIDQAVQKGSSNNYYMAKLYYDGTSIGVYGSGRPPVFTGLCVLYNQTITEIEAVDGVRRYSHDFSSAGLQCNSEKYGVSYSAVYVNSHPVLMNLGILTDVSNVLSRSRVCSTSPQEAAVNLYKNRGVRTAYFPTTNNPAVPNGNDFLTLVSIDYERTYHNSISAGVGGIDCNQCSISISDCIFEYVGKHAICSAGGKTTVDNCLFRYIGGSIQTDFSCWTRYGNAIETYGPLTNSSFTVKNCSFDTIFDAAITMQGVANPAKCHHYIYGNNISNARYALEFFGGKLPSEETKNGSKLHAAVFNNTIKGSDNSEQYIWYQYDGVGSNANIAKDWTAAVVTQSWQLPNLKVYDNIIIDSVLWFNTEANQTKPVVFVHNEIFVMNKSLVIHIMDAPNNIFTKMYADISKPNEIIDFLESIQDGSRDASHSNIIRISNKANTRGTFAQKPNDDDISIGHKYFCTDRQTAEGATDGIEIIYKGNNVWVDALGRVVS